MEENIPNFSTESLIPFPIDLIFSETNLCLAKATAFFYQKDESLYLITNWHNFTGLNPRTKKPLGNHAGKPDIVRFRMYQQNNDEFKFFYFDTLLYKDELMQNPSWLVHPEHREKVDVVALEIKISTDYKCVPINDSKLGFEEIRAKVADEVFIFGYPFNISQNGVLPIWKKASIATEPEFDYENLPMILVDTASRSGMSGSPVILRRKGVYGNQKGFTSTKQNFLGIYSGRILGETELEAQLGIVWKKEVINQIIEGRQNDEIKNIA